MADKTYGLAPFEWHAPQGTQPGYHSAPSGSLCVLDFRPIPQQSIQGQSGGYGFFAWEGAPPNDLIVLGVGDCRSIVSTPTMRNELRTKLGLAQQPSGATLIDVMYDCLGPLAVPDGSTGVRPLMPTSTNDLEIHLSGHSLVKSLKLNPAQLLSANTTGHANRIRDVIRMNLDIADEAGKLGEALGHWLMRCGYSREQVKAGAPGKKTEFERLCSAKVRAKYGNSLKPKEPKTSFTETWPNATSDIEGTAQDRSWETISDAPWFQTIVVVGNRARSSSGDDQRHFGRCLSAVSSADHIASALVYQSASYDVGVCSRMASGGVRDAYDSSYRFGSLLRLNKWVGGAITTLGSNAMSGSTSGATCTMRSNGSTQTATLTGASNVAVTDTAITGNLYGGIVLNVTTGQTAACEVGAWTLDDELPVAPVAAFTGTPLTGTSPLSVAFDSSATTNTPTSHLWEKKLGGGAWENFAGTPTIANPTESFTTGTWSVRYTATNAGGSNTKAETNCVVVEAAPATSSGHTRRTLTGLG